MSIQLNEHRAHHLLEIRVSVRLGRADYHELVPEFERLLEAHGKVRILLQMVDFHGWTPGALWEDLKFDFRHFNHMDRIAMVGDTRWEKAMSFFCRPFTTATVRWFDHDQLDRARFWLSEAEEPEPRAGSHGDPEPPFFPPAIP